MGWRRRAPYRRRGMVRAFADERRNDHPPLRFRQHLDLAGPRAMAGCLRGDHIAAWIDRDGHVPHAHIDGVGTTSDHETRRAGWNLDREPREIGLELQRA